MVLYIWLEFQVFDLSNEQREAVGGSHYCKNLYEYLSFIYHDLRMTSTFPWKQYISRKGETPMGRIETNTASCLC